MTVALQAVIEEAATGSAQRQLQEQTHAQALAALQAEQLAAMEVQAEQQERMAQLQQQQQEVGRPRCTCVRSMVLKLQLTIRFTGFS